MEKIRKHRDAIKNKPGIKFHSKPVYDKTYIKAKVREFDSVIRTNFLGNDVPKENMHYTCMSRFINTELKSDSDSDSELDSDLDSEKVGPKFDVELMAKLESGLDSD